MAKHGSARRALTPREWAKRQANELLCAFELSSGGRVTDSRRPQALLDLEGFVFEKLPFAPRRPGAQTLFLTEFAAAAQ
jgi:hypothetical protein